METTGKNRSQLIGTKSMHARWWMTQARLRSQTFKSIKNMDVCCRGQQGSNWQICLHFNTACRCYIYRSTPPSQFLSFTDGHFNGQPRDYFLAPLGFTFSWSTIANWHKPPVTFVCVSHIRYTPLGSSKVNTERLVPLYTLANAFLQARPIKITNKIRTLEHNSVIFQY